MEKKKIASQWKENAAVATIVAVTIVSGAFAGIVLGSAVNGLDSSLDRVLQERKITLSKQALRKTAQQGMVPN